ncbi:TPA: N-6 DNA methylase [Pseudomonas aeruginosa]|uniref:Eco57I restriction-modification methylase domain-containing protein n=1 Tax=Pseudomonas aeruginosa TaxID=287 RepID=UPI0024963DD5|nr:N-6 DNA methylase [Pseudomonas aeruginosa]MDI2559077.1 N-6 DNA methylase [Pseudomonas aeruginosa]HCF4138926.1 N-6 DNA methylase [Pseudomonas aeruginosa]HCL3672043.1 N-6 DNA methylase [Pseudomonas aeruginosa]HCL3880516.1 N-6 DNA methylase [Pseudomonas aeruginosa]
MSSTLITQIEQSRLEAQKHISEEKRKLEEQYFTPPRVAAIMARMFSEEKNKKLDILDPCSGVGNLAAAIYERIDSENKSHTLTLIEKDSFLFERSKENFSKNPTAKVIHADFFECMETLEEYDRIILNPPYAKISPNSKAAKLCYSLLNYSDTNIYSAFVSLCLNRLSKNGELVAIIPRSFCNGPLFKKFRTHIVENYSIKEFYSFDSRKVFSDSKVIQEVVIVKIGRGHTDSIRISHEKQNGEITCLDIPAERVIFPNDPNKVIHIPLAKGDDELLSKISRFKNTLSSIGMKASTGKVVDFRCTEFLQNKSNASSVNLIYQDSVQPGALSIIDIVDNRRPRHIKSSSETNKILLEKGNYVLVRRISFKESKTRIIAAPLLEMQFKKGMLGIENHLNYIWSTKKNMSREVCIALYSFLSTETVDRFVRRFSGHTQINATDLNSLPIPDIKQLESFYDSVSNISFESLATAAEEFFFST